MATTIIGDLRDLAEYARDLRAARMIRGAVLRYAVSRYVKQSHPEFYARKFATGQMSLFDQPATPAAADPEHPRAPAGGTTVGGEQFAGGEFVPKEKVEQVAEETGKSEEQVAAEIAQGEDPVDDGAAEQAESSAPGGALATFTDKETGMSALVLPGEKGLFTVTLRDDDSGEHLQRFYKFPTMDAAVTKAKSLVNQGGELKPPESESPDEPTAAPVFELTPEERSLYDFYKALTEAHNLPRRSPEDWALNYRAAQQRRRSAAEQATANAAKEAAAEAEESAPEEPASPVAPEESAKQATLLDPLVADNPREAAAEVDRKLDDDYEFARSSRVRNRGEDLKGSARHKVNAWRGLAQAEADGTAETLVTRANLLVNEPHNFGAFAMRNPLGALGAYLAMRKFPPRPGSGNERRDNDRDADTLRKDREQYLAAYRFLQQQFGEIGQSEDNPLEMVRRMNAVVAAHINALRKNDRYNNTANALIPVYKNLQWGGYKARKTSVATQLGEFAAFINATYGDLSPSDKLDRTAEHALDMLEGASLNKLRGISQERKKTPTFDAAEMYVKHATRAGGRTTPTADANAAADHMVRAMGLRGVQWGNSVSDDERRHHGPKALEAMMDLADTLGLEDADLSLGGRLGLAVGARGHGTALAHYEPDTQVINLTRKGGVGSLAHEWGHFFDHFLGNFQRGSYMSEDHVFARVATDQQGRVWRLRQGETTRAGWAVETKDLPDGEVRAAYAELRRASGAFRARLDAVCDDMVKAGRMSRGRSHYWTSNIEVFARTFERYVQRKLHAAGRENTYLAGLGEHAYRSGGLWPTDEEVDAMTPAFDAIFAAYSASQRRSEARTRDRYCKRLESGLRACAGRRPRKRLVNVRADG